MNSYIIPPDGGAEETARTLLALARDKRDVATNTDSGLAFVVPDYLADLFEAAQQTQQEPATPKRGRPRKGSD